MKIREIELSTLIKIGGILAMLAGFMYELEDDIVEIQQEQKKLHKRIIRRDKNK